MAGGQNLGEAVLKITLDTKTLKTQLDQLKKDIEGVQAGPVKLKPDGTGTRSRTAPADTAAKKAAADEARRVASLNALEARRFRIGRELNKLEERGVNISRLRSKLESNTLRRSSSQAEITSAREQTRSLERQVALRKDLADKEKRANAVKKDTTTPTPPAEAVKPAAVTDPRSVQRSLRSTRVDLTNLRRQGGDTNLAAESFNAAVEASQKGQLKNARDLIAETRTRIKEERSLLDAINDQGQAAANVGKPKGESSRLLTDINTNKSRLVRQNPGANLTEIDAKQAQAVDAAGKGQSAVVRRLKGEIDTLIRAERERLAGLKATTTELGKQETPAAPGGGGGGPTGPNGPTRPRKTQAERDAEEAKKKAAKAKRDEDRLAKQQKQENSARLNSALVGGAFPLQFGQGGFASAGGLIGGAVGGGPLGFGLSLVGTLVGSQIDELSNRFNTLAKALQDPIKSLDVFIEQASLASTAQEKLAKTLIDNGQEGRAESLLAGELARTIDPAIASRVNANTDNFNRALSDTKDILGQIVAGPSSEFLNFLAGVLSTINGVPSAPNPNATPEQRQTQAVENANRRKIPAQIAGSVSSGLLGPALGGILTAALTSGEEKDIRVAKSKEAFALEKKLSKEKKTQQQIEEATLSAQSQGLEETAKQLSLQAKLAGVTVKETKANKGAAEELERSKLFGFGSGDTKKAEAKRKEIKETADLERKALLAEQAGEKRSSGIKLSNAQRLRGLEGPARDIQTKKNSVSEAQREADAAQQIKNQRISESTGSTKDKALITAASDAATTANNKLKLSKVELNETTERAIKLAGRELDLAKSAVKGDRIGSLNKQINNVEEDRNFSLRKLGAGASLQEKEVVNLSADAKVLELQQQKKQLQNDLNQSLQSELIIRRGIAQQITASIAQQGAALARGDSAANPGNSVLAARAGDADARAFLEQNRQGVNSARSAEAKLQNQIKFEVDPSKITELQSKLATAAQATKLAMVEAGTALASKAADAAASLQGARDGLRSTLEGNIDKLPGQAQVDLKRSALGDVQRGIQSGILRPNINFNNTKSLLENASFVRQVEAAKAQVAAAEAQINALNANTQALQQGGAINVTINSDGAGGWQSGGAERIAA